MEWLYCYSYVTASFLKKKMGLRSGCELGIKLCYIVHLPFTPYAK